MVTWQSLSKQAEQLSWRDRLALVWRLVRSLFGKRWVPDGLASTVETGDLMPLAKDKNFTKVSGVPGQNLVKFAGLIPAEDLGEMSEAIAADCRRVNLNDW